MKPVHFHEDAAREARDAVEYYQGIQPELGQDFEKELEASVARFLENPKMYAAETGTVRRAPLNRFPYFIVYEELEERIWVSAVSHNSRRPGYWKKRRPE